MWREPFVSCSLRVARPQIAMLRFLVEGYDGLLFLRTVEPPAHLEAAIVELSWSPSQQGDAQTVLSVLAEQAQATGFIRHENN